MDKLRDRHLNSRFARLPLEQYQLPAGWAESVCTPALVVRLHQVRKNLQSVLVRLDGCADRWRPHVKTVKIPSALALFSEIGVRQFKAATAREARVLFETLAKSDAGAIDLLVAYPICGPSGTLLARLLDEFPENRISVLCESAAAAAELDPRIGLYIDLNPGMQRTGVPETDWERLGGLIDHLGSRFRGLHFYDGHIHGDDAAARRQMAHAGYDRLMGWIESRSWLEPFELVTSGTPAFLYALDYRPFVASTQFQHRVSPGTVSYHDLRTEELLEDLDLVPAATLLSRVVSHPSGTRVTCDAGSKSIAAEAGDPCAFVVGHPDWIAATPSEEHLPLDIASGELPPRGELIELIPRHVCPTVNLAEEAIIVDGETLSVERVAARAHDLWLEPR